MSATKRAMIEVRHRSDGMIEWAVLVPDTRKSGSHRSHKWRRRGWGTCPSEDALSSSGPVNSVLGALKPTHFAPPPKPLDPRKIESMIPITEELLRNKPEEFFDYLAWTLTSEGRAAMRGPAPYAAFLAAIAERNKPDEEPR